MLIDLLRFGALCAIQLCAGRTLLTLLRVPMASELRLLLGPAVLQALWASALSLGVTANVPVRRFTPYIWAVTVALALDGARLEWRPPRAAAGAGAAVPASRWLLPAWCALLALLALGPYLASGLTADYRGSGVPDGWSYVAVGQFLWDHARDSPLDGLSLLHRYGTAFAHQRHVAYGELGLLSWLVEPGDTQKSAGLLQALSLWSFALSCAAFARLRGHRAAFAAALAALTLLSGWCANLIWLSNYDHALALTFAPAMMAVVLAPEGSTLGGTLCLGLLTAGALHTYPELSPVLLGTTGAAALVQAWHDRQLAVRLRSGGVTLLVAAALVGIYWPDYLSYLREQSGTRPALAILRGLIEPRYMFSAFWALGGEHRVPLLLAGQSLAGIVLFALLAVGLRRLVRRGDRGAAIAVLLFLAGAGIGMFVWQYGYGTYKLILSGWWLLAYTLLVAAWPVTIRASQELSAPRSWVRQGLRAVPVLLLGAIPGAVLVRDVVVVPSKQPQPMAQLRVLREAPPIVHGAPIALLVDDLDAMAWSLYFLRDLPATQTRIGDFSGYLAAPQLRARVDHAEGPAWERIRFVLTDAEDRGPVLERPAWRLVWRKGAYALWDTGGAPWALVTDVQSGDEVVVRPLRAVPLGHMPTHLTMLASAPGRLRLTPIDGAAFAASARATAGDGAVQSHCTSGELRFEPAASPPALELHLPAGETSCTLHLAPARGTPAPETTFGQMLAAWEPAGDMTRRSGPPAGSSGMSESRRVQ